MRVLLGDQMLISLSNSQIIIIIIFSSYSIIIEIKLL